jgi:5-methylcytosine-specific restriction endonuclease McrA
MSMRPCLGANGAPCGELVAKGNRCPPCQSKVNRARGSSTARGYTSKWRRMSERIRKARPLCEIRLPGCTFLATATDHIVPLEDGGANTWANARPACTSCNNRRRYLKGDTQ